MDVSLTTINLLDKKNIVKKTTVKIFITDKGNRLHYSFHINRQTLNIHTYHFKYIK